nr:MAG TPA: hypothetical protein [Caudoviricetes sp.]
MRAVIVAYIIIAALGFIVGMILLCRAVHKSIQRENSHEEPGIVIFPVFLVLASIMWPLSLLGFIMLAIADDEQEKYDQRDL